MGSIQLMSDAEKEIMKLIWDNGGSIFISELLEKVEEMRTRMETDNGQDISYPSDGKGAAYGSAPGKEL